MQRIGFREALEEPTALAKFVVRKERLNMDVLPCPASERLANAAELLGTKEMEQLIEVARETYDLVIIEAPPMAAVVDYKMIARHCSGFIFVVEWGKTSQRLVRECLSDASVLLDRVHCVVLNKVDPSCTAEHRALQGRWIPELLHRSEESVSPLNAENSSAFPSTRWNAGRRGFCKRGPYGSIFARASLEAQRHSRISVVGKVERKWSMSGPLAARFF